MALNGNAFAVDPDRMRAAYGSRDEALLAALLEGHADAFEPFDAPADVEAGRSLRQAVEQIIFGDCRLPPDDRFLYGYAIEVLCRHFGEVVPVPDDPQFNEIGDPEDLEIDGPLLSGELPLPVPAWGDAPYVRFLTPAQVVAEYERLSAEDLSHDEPSIEQGRRTLLAQLKWTRDRGKAFVTVVAG